MSLDLEHPPLSSTSRRISSTLVAPFLFPFGLTSPARPPDSRQTIDAKPIDSWSRTRRSRGDPKFATPLLRLREPAEPTLRPVVHSGDNTLAQASCELAVDP
jgi:hypothetical protein